VWFAAYCAHILALLGPLPYPYRFSHGLGRSSVKHNRWTEPPQKLIELFGQFEPISLGQWLIVGDVTGDARPDRGELARIVGTWEAAKTESCGPKDVFQSRIWPRVVGKASSVQLPPSPDLEVTGAPGSPCSIRTEQPPGG
jgi:hypothetical protein